MSGKFENIERGFTHESAVGPHPWVKVTFALNDFDGRDAFAESLAAIRAPVAVGMEPVGGLMFKLIDLLDDYRDETACKTYNGWVKRREPTDIRKDIDAILELLTRPATPSAGAGGSVGAEGVQS